MQRSYRDVPLDLAQRVLPQSVRDYAKARGWRRVPSKLNDVAVYAAPIQGRYEQVVVPVEPTLDDYAERVADAAANMAAIESRSQLQVIKDLLYPESDTLRFGVTGNGADRGSLGLTEGIDLLEGAKRSLLASACSVVSPEKHHPRMSRTEADQILKASRLNHTEQGSFVVTITCPLRALDSDSLMEIAEPFTRKTTSLLMRSVSRLVRAIENDAMESALAEIGGEPTISANLCDALLRMQPSGDGVLNVMASWAPVLPPPRENTPPQNVRIRREYFEPIADVYERLRPKTEARPSKYIGTVETLNGSMDEEQQRRVGEVTLLLLDEGDLFRARLDLNADQYQIADRAHMNGLVVVVRGDLQRGKRVGRFKTVESFNIVEQND